MQRRRSTKLSSYKGGTLKEKDDGDGTAFLDDARRKVSLFYDGVEK